MTCLHNHDQILEFLRKIFLKGFQIYQNYLCALSWVLPEYWHLKNLGGGGGGTAPSLPSPPHRTSHKSYVQTQIRNTLYRVSQKSGTADFQYLASYKCHIFWHHYNYKASSAEENDTKIIKFGWVILNLCTLLEIQSF